MARRSRRIALTLTLLVVAGPVAVLTYYAAIGAYVIGTVLWDAAT